MRPSCDLDVFGDLTVAGDPAVMRPIQPDVSVPGLTPASEKTLCRRYWERLNLAGIP
jgi:hypothetical protein